MNNYSAAWLILLFILLNSVSFNISLYHDKVPCFQIGNCKCEFPNGLGIDLGLLRGQNFSVNIATQEELIYFPCKNGQVANITNATALNECESGVSLCHKVQNVDKKFSFYNVGSSFESSFLWERINDDPVLIFNHGNRSAHINLNCDHDAKDARFTLVNYASGSNYKLYNSQLNQLNEAESATFVLNLITDLACLTTVAEEGRSVFSTLFIIILVLFLVYFFGGFLVLRFIRGARGWEAIPNADFWRSIWTSIKQMFAYISHGCRQPETYDTI